ncbi:hypothetical protein EJB05_34372, partial [Eragrostis curvula]
LFASLSYHSHPPGAAAASSFPSSGWYSWLSDGSSHPLVTAAPPRPGGTHGFLTREPSDNPIARLPLLPLDFARFLDSASAPSQSNLSLPEFMPINLFLYIGIFMLVASKYRHIHICSCMVELREHDARPEQTMEQQQDLLKRTSESRIDDSNTSEQEDLQAE